MLCHAPHSFLQKPDGIRPAEALIGIGEVRADIAHRAGAQQGVRQRVGGHIRVAVAKQAQFIGDIHPAEDQPPSLRQPVHVIAKPRAGKPLRQ